MNISICLKLSFLSTSEERLKKIIGKMLIKYDKKITTDSTAQFCV